MVIAFVGLVNQGKNLKPERILKLLIYAAAEAGAMRLIETIFSLPAGRIVFEVYKDDSALPEDIAEENGHREVAVYLRGVTERSVEFQVHLSLVVLEVSSPNNLLYSFKFVVTGGGGR